MSEIGKNKITKKSDEMFEEYLSLQECIEKLDVLKRIPAPVELSYLDEICILGWLKELNEYRCHIRSKG